MSDTRIVLAFIAASSFCAIAWLYARGWWFYGGVNDR